ncbi:MAG: hypothetical protein ACLUD0_06815 [Eubacterium ramulus]
MRDSGQRKLTSSFKLCDYDTRQFVVNRLGENYQNHSISAPTE